MKVAVAYGVSVGKTRELGEDRVAQGRLVLARRPNLTLELFSLGGETGGRRGVDPSVELAEHGGMAPESPWPCNHQAKHGRTTDAIEHDAEPAVDLDDVVNGGRRKARVVDSPSDVGLPLDHRHGDSLEEQLQDTVVRPGEHLGRPPFGDQRAQGGRYARHYQRERAPRTLPFSRRSQSMRNLAFRREGAARIDRPDRALTDARTIDSILRRGSVRDSPEGRIVFGGDLGSRPMCLEDRDPHPLPLLDPLDFRGDFNVPVRVGHRGDRAALLERRHRMSILDPPGAELRAAPCQARWNKRSDYRLKRMV